MEAIILCGGLGTRLREVVSDVPKPMAPISGKPFLEYLLMSLKAKGFSRVILSVGYLSEIIIHHFGNSFEGIDISYVIETEELGTGGATKLALAAAGSQDIFVLNGDTFLDFEASEILQQRKRNSKTIIVARNVPDTSRFGKIVINGGEIINFSEKHTKGPGIINAGCYVFSKNELDDFEAASKFSLETEYLSKHKYFSRFDVYTTEGMFIDIGVPKDYELAANLLAQ